MIFHDLTRSQQLIWTGQQLNPTSPQYNMAFAFEFKCKIDPDKFKSSFEILVNELDAMRSIFVEKEGVPKLIVKEKMEFDFKIHHLDKKEANSWIQKEVQRNFNLEECLFDTAFFIHGEDHYTWYLNQHHLITDGWSCVIQYHNLMNIYEGVETQLPQYRDYLTKLPEPNNDASLYWSNQIQEITSQPEFNNKKNDHLKSSSERLHHTLTVQETNNIKAVVLEKELRTWSVDLGVFNLLLSVLAATVAKLTEKRDLVIGSPALNRANSKLKNTAGLFIEMFPIQVPLKAGETYESLYQSTLQNTNNFLRYAQPESSSAALNRTFNVVLNYINGSFKEHNQVDMEATWIHAGSNDPGHHVQLQVIDFNNTGQITFAFDLNNEIFNQEEKSEFVSTFLKELDLFIEDRTQLIFHSDAKELAFIDAVNKTDYSFPQKSLLAYFDENVKSFPTEIALVFEGKSMSFEMLDKKSSELSYYLKSLGVKEQTNIGLFLPRSFELIIAILAILKIRSVYIPIDQNYPKRRVEFILEDADIHFILCKAIDRLSFESTDVMTIPLDGNWGKISQATPFVIDLNSYPEDLMYIIYTSGSTGTPKGVMNKHEGVMNRLNWAKKEKHLSRQDVVLLKTTYTFDVSGIELLMPLMVGCKLVIAIPEGHKDPVYLRGIINEQKVTYIHFVPSMLEVFLLGMEDLKLPSLKRVICSGEALQVDHVKSFKRIFPAVILQNLYGPTEAAIEVASWLAPDETNELMHVPIGKPIDNVKLKIVDKRGNSCALNVPGELFIGGIQVAAGYVKRPELTEAKFLKDEETGYRWYKTGDLCQWMKDGNIEYLGRIDQQVKVRGFRIELGEIEQVAKELEEIKSCVALVKNDQILLYSVQSGHVNLKKHLQENLPEYMIPSHFIDVNVIPTLDNGKIDRKKLLGLAVDRKSTDNPSNEFEEFVFGIWSKVLSTNNFGIHDEFFDIGGDSLSGIRVITSINAELELELPIVTIFQRTSVAAMAIHIEAEIDRRMAEA